MKLLTRSQGSLRNRVPWHQAVPHIVCLPDSPSQRLLSCRARSTGKEHPERGTAGARSPSPRVSLCDLLSPLSPGLPFLACPGASCQGPSRTLGLACTSRPGPACPHLRWPPVPRVTLGLGLAHLGHLLPGGDVPAFAGAHPSVPASLPRLPAPDGTSELTQSCLEKCSRDAASAIKVKGTHLGPKVIPDLQSRAATWPLCDTGRCPGLHLPPK